MTAHWMFVFGDSRALQWVLENNRMAFRDHVRTNAIDVRDRFVVYTSRGAYGNPTKDDAQVLALGTVASTVREGAVAIEREVFPKSCDIAIDTILPLRSGVVFRGLIPNLAFVGRSERRWPSAVHRTLVELPSEDFDVIASAIRRQLDGAVH